MSYLFQSARLGFRNWKQVDLQPFASICADPEVMQYFPSTLTLEQVEPLFQRLQEHYEEHGFTYFAVDRLDQSKFIGFIGLAKQSWESEFTPCVDLGYRLARSQWGHGFATEGAKACLKAGFEMYGLEQIFAFTPDLNLPSQKVMQKIGMRYAGELQHPKIDDDSRFKHCVAYSMINMDFESETIKFQNK